MKKIKRTDYIPKFVVDWNIGKRCNFDCSYCPSTIHDNHSPHTALESLTTVVDKLQSFSTDRKLKIVFTGGEPTVNPNISSLLYYIKAKGIDLVTLTTNGTRKPDWYLSHSDCISSLTISLHYERDWNKTVDTILNIHKAFKMFAINIMVHHNFYDEVKQTIELLLKENVNFRLKRIRWSENDLYLNDDYDDTSMYDGRFIDLFNSYPDTDKPNIIIDDTILGNTNDIVKFRQNNFYGWKCFAGIEGICIDPAGEVYRGTCKQGGSIGNIYFDDNFIIDKDPITCYKQYCSCVSDVLFTKYKESE